MKRYRNPPRAAAEVTARYLRENFGNVVAARRLATQLEAATTDTSRRQLLRDAEQLLLILQGDKLDDPHELDRALLEGSLELGQHGLAVTPPHRRAPLPPVQPVNPRETTIDGQLDALLALLREDPLVYNTAVELAYYIAATIDAASPLRSRHGAIRLCELLECIPEHYRRLELESNSVVIATHRGNVWSEEGWIEVTRADLKQINLGGNTYVNDHRATEILRFIYLVDEPLTNDRRYGQRTTENILQSITQVLNTDYGQRAPDPVQVLVLDSGISLGDYINLGETYGATIIHLTHTAVETLFPRAGEVEARWIVHSWGDIVEKWENRHPPFDRAGTVSEGTLRTNDLIPVFVAELEMVAEDPPIGTQDLIQEAHDWLNMTPTTAPLLFQTEAQRLAYLEHGDELVQALEEDLNTYAPVGYYFGTHPGDGADFGWWLLEE